tara:strand:+ start:9298 stop:9843 length:546 start_codon:yes stop_codon:yes gene_type:complete
MLDLFYEQNLTEVSTDIFHTRFLNEELSDTILTLLKKENAWERGVYDRRYSTHDTKLSSHFPTVYHLIKEQIENIVLRSMYDIWSFNSNIEADSIFAVKYSKDTQLSLKEHVDESYISGSIKLNTDYEGGILKFPRQNFTNENIPIGDLIIWPSQITHPHLSTKVTKGEKYSITIWTDSQK